MKSIGSTALTILIGFVVLIVALKLLGAALKLVGLLIVVALAVGAYFVVQGKIGKGGGGG